MSSPIRSCRSFGACLTAAAAFLFTAMPTAQADEVIVFAPGLLTTTTTTAGVVVVSATGPFLSTTSSTSSSGGHHHHRHCQAEEYLRHNQAAVRQALALGAGQGVDDLATLFAVPPDQRASFARTLRQHRATLLPLIDLERLDTDQARRFVESIDHLLAHVVVHASAPGGGTPFG